MARRISFENIIKSCVVGLQNGGRETRAFQSWYASTCENLSISEKIILDKLIDAWIDEHPQLWQDFGKGDYHLVVNGVQLATLQIEGKKVSITTIFDKPDNLLYGLPPDIDPTDKFKSVQQLQRSIGTVVTRHINETLDVLLKVYTDV